jgi:integrase
VMTAAAKPKRITSTRSVEHAAPGKHKDDKVTGLRLDVDARGNASWVFRYKSPVTAKERYMGLGAASDVGLEAARAAAQAARALIAKGVDPIEHRVAGRAAEKVAAAGSVTFRDYAEGYIARFEKSWKNPKHRQQWTNSLKNYVYPLIGSTPVRDVDTTSVMSVLTPIWNSKPETASRVRGRIEMILTAAKAEGLRTGDNPAAWRERIKPLLPSKRKVRAVVHHPALPYPLLPKFMISLRADQSDSALLLQFIIGTAARYNEGALADWSEIDEEQKLWSIPGVRMKGDRADRPHVVPLNDTALAVLSVARERYGRKGLIFPGMRTGKPVSDVTLAKAIARHTNVKATTHGFRSTFRDWAGDMTNFPRELCEQALAHVIEDETEAAYRRSDALAKRRLLMDEWAEYCMSERR